MMVHLADLCMTVDCLTAQLSTLCAEFEITQLLAEARMKQGDKFNLRIFHDFVWKNGNARIALQRWELLGRREDVPRIDAH
jgi:hypothetical protein